MTSLITGGAGFIGSHLAEALHARGEAVVVLDDLSTGRRANLATLDGQPGFRFVQGSILDEPLVAELVAGCDSVYHLAAAVGVRRILEQPLEAILVNQRGSEHVLAAAAASGKPTLLASTSEVYGKNDSGPLREDADSILGPTSVARWLYATTKAADEFLALAYHREHGLPVVIVRFFNTVGPRQTGQYGMVVPRFVEQALRGEPLTVFGDGRQLRCFTAVQDAVAAILALMACPRAAGQVFNIGNSREVSINDLARRVLELTGSASPIRHVSYVEAYGHGFEDMRRRVPDASKLRATIGFAPGTDLDSILHVVITSLRRQLPSAPLGR